MPLRRSLTAVAIIIVVSLPASADDVTLIPNSTISIPGGRITGTIESETPTSLRIAPGSGAAREIPIDQVATIAYTGQPATLQLAESAERSGQYDRAAELFGQTAEQAGGKPLIVQRAQYGRAHALTELALADPTRGDEALAALDTFVAGSPNSRHLGPALEHIARLTLSRGELDRAGAAIDRLKPIAWAAERAAILESRVLAARGQHDQAVSTLDAIIARAPHGSTQAVEASLTRADVLAGSGQYAEAESAARAVIEAAGPEAAEIQALAHNTLGDCLRAANRPRDALYAYLHTDILYDVDKEQHARALAAIADLWRELGQANRADEALGRLKQLYPQSTYAKDAE